MKHQVSYAVTKGVMELIASGAGTADFTSFGLSDEDYGILTGNRQWVPADRVTIERTMNVLLYGIMDISGTSRFAISAEYLAAAIAVFVQPQNIMVACEWAAVAPANSSLAEAEKSLETEAIPGSQIFALVLQCKAEPNTFKDRFEQRTTLEVLTEE